MIINFSNLGGGGGGSYVLPVATNSRLGGVKVGSGLTITNDGVLSSNGGGTDPNAQHWFTASTKSDAQSMTGLTEGDIVIVQPSTKNTDAPDYFYQALTEWSMNFIDSLNMIGVAVNNGYTGQITFTVRDNTSPSPSSDVEGELVIKDSDGAQVRYYGIKNHNIDEFKVLTGSTTYDDEDWVVLTGNSYSIQIVSGHTYEEESSSTPDDLYKDNDFGEKKLDVSYLEPVPGETLQLNNGTLISLANNDDVQSAMSDAYNALQGLDGKVNNSGLSISHWVNAYTSASTIGPVYVNDVYQGVRISASGASSSELTTPKVDEIMTNRNPGVVPPTLRVVSLNQSQYDALVSGGTVSDNTLYIIVDDTKWQN